MPIKLEAHLYPSYIKKSQVNTILKKQQELLAMILASIVIILAIIQLLIIPKIIAIYLHMDMMILAEDLLRYSRIYISTSGSRLEYYPFLII